MVILLGVLAIGGILCLLALMARRLDELCQLIDEDFEDNYRDIP